MTSQDAVALREWLGYTHDVGDPGWERFGPLSFNRRSPSLCGLNDWPAPAVNRSGNLAERDYSVESVAECLRELVKVAPSMLLIVHCGGERESTECVATIRVGEGLVAAGKPEVAEIEPVSAAQAELNVLRALTGGY